MLLQSLCVNCKNVELLLMIRQSDNLAGRRYWAAPTLPLLWLESRIKQTSHTSVCSLADNNNWIKSLTKNFPSDIVLWAICSIALVFVYERYMKGIYMKETWFCQTISRMLYRKVPLAFITFVTPEVAPLKIQYFFSKQIPISVDWVLNQKLGWSF